MFVHPSLFDKCVMHFTGVYENSNGFPILPTGVTVTPNGVWTSSELGNNHQVRVFDGSTNYISLTDSTAWSFGPNNVTISVWVKPTISVGPGSMRAIAGQRSGSTNNTISFLLWQGADNTIYFYFYSGFSYYGSSTDGYYDINIWNHIVCVRFENSILIYKNSVLLGTYNFGSGLSINDSSAPLVIGAEGYFIDDASKRFGGSIASFQIWKDRALTQPEIQMLMKLTDPVNGYGILPGITSAGKLYDKMKVV